MSQVLNDDANYINANQNTVYALDGDDVVKTDQGGPNLYGGAGNDFLGNFGDGILDAEGGQGNDTIHGGTLGDRIYGGTDNDLLAGGEFDYGDASNSGAIHLFDNEVSGNDYLDGGAGNDAIYGFEGDDILLGGDGDDFNVNISGGSIKDNYQSASFYATIFGGLYGGDGKDFLDGGRGNDYLSGGAGKDTLVGGIGSDAFTFDAKLGSKNVDTIIDFSHADDTIWLDDDIFTALGAVSPRDLDGREEIASSSFWASNSGKAHQKDDRILYDKTDGHLYYDADGTGKGKAVLFADLDAHLKMGASDFLLIA